MTAVVGFVDKKTGNVWVGADSCASNGTNKYINAAPKVFRSRKEPWIVMGGTTSFRHLDLLQYASDLFDGCGKTLTHQFMVESFVPRVIKLFQDGVVSEEKEDRGGSFIVAAPGKLFAVQEDFSVIECLEGIHAVGQGAEVALGSLVTTLDMDNFLPRDKVLLALRAAEHLCTGVNGPFNILCVSDSPYSAMK